jgi:hypothetical protein
MNTRCLISTGKRSDARTLHVKKKNCSVEGHVIERMRPNKNLTVQVVAESARARPVTTCKDDYY